MGLDSFSLVEGANRKQQIPFGDDNKKGNCNCNGNCNGNGNCNCNGNGNGNCNGNCKNTGILRYAQDDDGRGWMAARMTGGGGQR